MIARLAALALCVALAAPAARAEDEVSAQATLHVRSTTLRDLPGHAVLYDPASRTFLLDGYLAPSVDDRYGSTFASLSVEGGGLGGDLHWRLALDTGELRQRSFQDVADVCLSGGSTGLAQPGSGACTLYPGPDGPRRIILGLEQTGLQSPTLTSNGRLLQDEVKKTLLVREAYAALSFGRAGFATARAGRKRVSVGDGFVYDDYASGAEIALDIGAIGPPLAITLSLFQPTRDAPKSVAGISPFLALRADWLPSLFEHAGVFAAVHRDRTGSIAELFRGAIVEKLVGFLDQSQVDTVQYRTASQLLARTLAAPMESDSTLAWVGSNGLLTPWHGQRFAWTAALVRGQIDHVSAGGTTSVDAVKVDGRLLSARWNTSVGDRLGLGAFVVYLSGGNFPLPPPGQQGTGQYGGFLGIAPFITATNLFFNGGLSESFAARQATAPGVNGRGVTAPGISIAVDPIDAVGLELKAAHLVAPVKGPYGGRTYGNEVDLVLTWAARPWLLLGAEFDALRPGDFFAGSDTLYKTVVAVDLLTP